jgi:hypothetical protein
MNGFRDIQEKERGLEIRDSDEKRITVRDNLIFCDTRDCVGLQSLHDTQNIFKIRGGRSDFSENILSTTGDGVSPIVVTVVGTVAEFNLKNGDKVDISGVQGNKAANGFWVIAGLVVGFNATFELRGSVGNGNYAGGGTIIRYADSGWPVISDETSYIHDNEMIIKLPKKLKVLKSLSLIHTVIPRDIIPMVVYLPDFLEFSEFNSSDVPLCPLVRVATSVSGVLATSFNVGDTVDGVVLVLNDRILIKNQTSLDENGIYIVKVGAPDRSSDLPNTTPSSTVLNYYVTATEGTVNINTSWVCTIATGAVGVGDLTFSSFSGVPISWVSYIPQEKKELELKTIGFYSTPLDLFRTYINGVYSVPNQYTPPPLKLWNPTVGGATHQLQPYPFQVVPTYTSDSFSVNGFVSYIILSGYGVYDLNDWTYRLDPDDLVNEVITRIARTILLLVICPNQSYNDQDSISLIINTNTTTVGGNSVDFFGYGDFQRFIPGPGINTHYQPGTSDGADPTVTRTDSPVPFPYYRGNVWGPYSSPGDRFQRMGTRDCLQDLYLNGDLNNLFGTNIIKPWVSVECIPTDVTFGIFFPAFIPVTFGNIEEATNPNITNAMRIVSNGFGALSITSLGNGVTFTNRFLNSGGQGPDISGPPSDGYQAGGSGGAWVDNEVLDSVGTGVFGDEIASGINNASGTFSNSVDASSPGNETNPITNRVAWYDFGVQGNNFVGQMVKYRNWVIKDLPDTNLIISIFQAERDQRVQFMNQNHTSCILSCPIRLKLGTSNGTQEYIESLQPLLSNSTEFWEKKYLPPLQSLDKLSVKFTTFEGYPIPLEKMLQPRRSILLFQSFERIFGNTTANVFNNQNTILYDPLDPRLVKREKRNISMTFKVETYEYESPGLYIGIIRDMLETSEQRENHHPFVVRASNFENYS